MTQVRRTALVTGAAGGIGRTIARHLAGAGFAVALCDLDGKAAAEAAADLPGQHAGFAMDVSDSGCVAAVVAAVEGDLGEVDVLVNNAGIDKIEKFTESTEETWRAVISVNYLGTVIVTRAVLDGMIARGYGRIVNISSDAGRIGTSLEPLYTGAKGGVIAFAKTLAREVARDGVTVNTVCPGMIDTPALRTLTESHERLFAAMTQRVPVRRPGEPRDIAAAVAYFASDDAGYVTGQTLSVNGGLSMV